MRCERRVVIGGQIQTTGDGIFNLHQDWQEASVKEAMEELARGRAARKAALAARLHAFLQVWPQI